MTGGVGLHAWKTARFRRFDTFPCDSNINNLHIMEILILSLFTTVAVFAVGALFAHVAGFDKDEAKKNS